MPISRLLLISTFIASLTVQTILTVGATITLRDHVRRTTNHRNSDRSRTIWRTIRVTGTYKVSLIGIEVSNGRSELKSGARLAGIEIYQVLPDSPRAAAGLQGRRAAVRVALVALTVGGLFFPRAAVLGAMVMKHSRIDQSHELIIAVDAQRTRNVGELESALGQAEPGETVYLTVVSGGRREQVHVNLP